MNKCTLLTEILEISNLYNLKYTEIMEQPYYSFIVWNTKKYYADIEINYTNYTDYKPVTLDLCFSIDRINLKMYTYHLDDPVVIASFKSTLNKLFKSIGQI